MSPTNAERYPLRVLRQSLKELKDESLRARDVRDSYKKRLAEYEKRVADIEADITDITRTIQREKG